MMDGKEGELPHTGGVLIASAQCLRPGDSPLWEELAHYPDRGQWWASEGEWWCYLYSTTSGGYLSGIQESNHLRAADIFNNRLKHYIRRYIDGNQKTEE